MTSLRLGWLFCVGSLSLALAFATPIFAQYKEIDHTGNEFAKEFMKARPEATIVAVADLRDTDGTNKDQGHYFSLILTSAISLHMKNGFAVADHIGFDAALKSRAISAQALATPKSMTEIAGKINVIAVVIGDFQQDKTTIRCIFRPSACRMGQFCTPPTANFATMNFLIRSRNPFRRPRSLNSSN